MSDLIMKMFQMRLVRGFPLIAIFVAMLTGMLAPMNAAWAEDFTVLYDQSKLLRLARPANTIIVGNPSIADVAIQGKKLLVVTGKSFGLTNLIVLDAKGSVILNRKLIVQGNERKIVNLQRGKYRQSYNCSPTCQPTLVVGDQAGFTELLIKGIKKKNTLSSKQSNTGGR